MEYFYDALDILQSNIVWFILVGALGGWIAGRILQGQGYGIVGNIVIGVIGAAVGQLVFGLLGIGFGGGTLGAIITAVIGSMVLVMLVGFIKKRKRK